ncbi:MAG: tRNA pseudouridine(55) synthase TruB [Planctomycetota bacterium]|nr:tRNA pseudouridine(55) synthase TruB [Planctomycetota bacterium]
MTHENDQADQSDQADQPDQVDEAEPNQARAPERPNPMGIMVIDKPEGPTSMDVVARVRSRFRRAGYPKSLRVGHGGTLDPLATGVVVVLVGKATKLCDAIMAGEKRYIAEIDLAHTSPTQDRERAPEPVPDARDPGEERVRAVLQSFVGTFSQMPPVHSALNVGGVRAYALARQGHETPVKPRDVFVRELTLVAYAWPRLTIDLACGKGTYVRSLARDVGLALGGPQAGVGGMLWTLRRTAVGRFTVDRATRLDRLPDVLSQDDLEKVE